jgi:hypothetical protein
MTATLFLLLDAASGELREGAQNESDLVLLPPIEARARRLASSGVRVVLVIPRALEHTLVTELARASAPFEVVAVASLDELKLGPPSDRRVLAASDRTHRQFALDRLGIDAAPHLVAAEWALQGKSATFVRVKTRRRPDLKTVGLLPYAIERAGDEWNVLGLLTAEGRLVMLRAGASIASLPFDARRGDCAWLRFDTPAEAREAHWEGAEVLAVEGGRVLLALRDREPASVTAPRSGHGMIELLLPSPELLAPPVDADARAQRTVRTAAILRRLSPEVFAPKVPLPHVTPPPLPDAATFRADAERYSGLRPLSASVTITSRHIDHPDNARAVDALVAELDAMGLCTSTHTFTYGGRTLKNVIADLPGVGYLRIRPEILEKILEIIRHLRDAGELPPLDAPPWRALDPAALAAFGRAGQDVLRAVADDITTLRRVAPYCLRRRIFPGLGAKIVIVGCHLDSTAASTPGYHPATDAAPGLDDNASGIAACLAAARYLSALKGTLTHTVRFCFFNAEEQGLVGSKAYAATLKAAGAPVKAAICTDMIGYNSDAQRIFEVHAGYSDPSVRDRSVTVATAIESAAAGLGVLAPAQIYKGTSSSTGAPDRNLYDPAMNRSDHGAFHQQGYAAVVVSEDYFTNTPAEPMKDPNPYYHSANDRTIDDAYGAAITAAIVTAARELADP